MQSDPQCIFCQIVAGKIPCFKLYEDDNTIAFMDINPAQPGHALAIAKAHFADLYAIPDEAVAATVRTARKVALAIKETLAPEGLNLLQCNGPAAAQSVDHFHLHILPRAEGDGLAMNWDPVPGDRAEIGKLAERIRTNLS